MSDTWTWRKSSRSVGNGQCVEIARPSTSEVGLRDSKNPDGRHLQVSQTAFGAFLTTIKSTSA